MIPPIIQEDPTLSVPTTIGVEVSLDGIPSDDPLAFCTGFLAGLAGADAPPTPDDAGAYIAGKHLGDRVRQHKTSMPTWARSLQ